MISNGRCKLWVIEREMPQKATPSAIYFPHDQFMNGTRDNGGLSGEQSALSDINYTSMYTHLFSKLDCTFTARN